jgi:hypothetical protein
MLVGSLLNGEAHAAEFIPQGSAPLAIAGLGAVGVLGLRTGRWWRVVAILLLAVTMFAPCFYYTFLWNRLRYLWPFATGWLVGLACLARLAGDLAGTIRPRWRVVTGLLCGAFVGVLAAKIDWVIDDIAQSASAIDRQQVALGRWAKDHLPASARIGVNDTGAIAYFGEHPTFDVVGLTSEGEGRYWVQGPGSRLEHYERMQATDPSRLPTHFIVYPEWMRMNCVLGDALHSATVNDSTILGGQTMTAYVADWSKLGSGDLPWTSLGGGRMADVLDVADLESERDHGYELRGAREGENVAHQGIAPDGPTVVDGGRTNRTIERFMVRVPRGAHAMGVVRLDGRAGTSVHVLADGQPAGDFDLGDDEDWVERTFEVPPSSASELRAIEIRAEGGTISTFHYWFVVPPEVTPG